MEKYAEPIIRILRDSNISCGYKAAKKTVYAHRREQYGEIFSFYCLSGTELNSLIIYSLPIPESRQDAILSYLLEKEEPSNNSYFYIDPNTKCMVFNSVYKTTGEPISADDYQFINFCKKGYEIFHNYQDALYALTGRHMEKCNIRQIDACCVVL